MTAPPLIDSHCHLDFPDFAAERDAIMTRAAEAGIEAMITISTRVRQFDQVRAIAEAHPNVFCTVGTHPHYADEEDGITAREIAELAGHPKVVGIGECGLDHHYDNASHDAQERGFRTHIEAARMTGLPVVIHSRSADEDTARVLTEESKNGPFDAVLHCFTGGQALAETGIELGHHVSFSGILTFGKADELRTIAARLPADRILVETDAPYLAPAPHRGKRNEPSYVRETARRLAEVRGVREDEIARITRANTLALFGRMKLPGDTSLGG